MIPDSRAGDGENVSLGRTGGPHSRRKGDLEVDTEGYSSDILQWLLAFAEKSGDLTTGRAPVSALVLANGQVQGDMQADHRQLCDKLRRTVAIFSGGPSSTATGSLWHLTTLPLLAHREAVGALVLVGQLDFPVANPSLDGLHARAALEAAKIPLIKATAELADEFFATPASLACAQNVRTYPRTGYGVVNLPAGVRDKISHASFPGTKQHGVAALLAAVWTAPDHAAAVRNAALQIHALLPSITIPTTNTAEPSSQSALPTVAAGAAATSATPHMLPHEAPQPQPPSPQQQQQQRLVVTTGLVISRAATSRSCAASINIPANGTTSTLSTTTTNTTTTAAQINNVTNSSSSSAVHTAPSTLAGPVLHLYHSSSGRSNTTLPAAETLVTRAPIQADVLAAMLSEALAAPVNSAALAAAQARGAQASGGGGTAAAIAAGRTGSVMGLPQPPPPPPPPKQQRHQKLLALRCPEDELPPSQPRADLEALEAAGARAPRGSVVMVSCPLPSIMCTVVVYVCVAPPQQAVATATAAACPAAAAAAASCRQATATPGGTALFGGSGSNINPANHGAALQPPGSAPVPCGPSSCCMAQLPQAQLNLILRHLSSAVEIMASALEQRMLSSCAASPQARLGSKGPCAVDVTASTTGLLTVSIAGTDAGEDSNGFWGSASGPILSGETIATSQLSANTANIPTSQCNSHSAGCTSSSHGGQTRALQKAMNMDVKAAAALPPPRAWVSAAANVAVAAASAPSPLTPSIFTVPEVTGSEALTAGPSLAKLPSTARRQAAAKATASDTDVLEDTSAEATEGTAAAAATTTAVAAAGVASGVQGASSSAAVYCSSTSGSSGVETTINALALGQMDSPCLGGLSASSFAPGGGGAQAAASPPSGGPVATASATDTDTISVYDAPNAGLAAVLPVGGAATASAVPPLLPPHGAGSSSKLLLAAAAGLVLPPAAENAIPLLPASTGAAAAVAGGAGCSGRGGGPASSSSGDRMSRVMVRNRSKDWSDQSSEPEGALDCRFSLTGEVGAAVTAAAAARRRPMKVLSLDKAAQQLQRSSGSSLAMTMQPALPPPPPLLQLPPALQQPLPDYAPYQTLQSVMTCDRRGQSAGGSAAAAASAPPPPYVPYMPRRLNRMYLQPAALFTSNSSAAAGGVPVSAAGVAAKATLLGGPYGTVLVPPPATAAAAAAASTTTSLAQLPLHLKQQHVQLTARAVGRVGDAAAAGSRAAAAAGQFSLFASVAANGATHGSTSNATAPSGRSLPTAVADPSSAAAAVDATPSPLWPSAGLFFPAQQLQQQQERTVQPAFAATVAAARAASAGAGAECPTQAPGGSQKSRQLSDYAIPEDAPLEYTVSETVQMMRMLAQARGVHLSSRMRRVRVTAKIQSAHPDTLPADLPSQIAQAALLAPHAGTAAAGGGGLFADRPRGGKSPWVLTAVAARRGCVELVFDVVQVRGGGGSGMMSSSGSQPHGLATQSPVPGHATSRVASGAQSNQHALGFTAAAPTAAQPHAHCRPGSSGYRRWQGGGMDLLSDPLRLRVEPEDVSERLAAKSPAAAGAAAVGEQLWLRHACGLRPEAVAEVLHSCGLLNPASDPYVDIQIGHTSAGVGTLVWHEAAGQWVMSAGSAAGGAPAAATAAAVTSAGSGGGGGTDITTGSDDSSLEAPTLWLPSSVTLLAPGSRVLKDIRVVSTSGSCGGGGGRLGGDVIDEWTVRSAYGYLPARVAAGLRMHAGGAAGSGSSVVPLPLLLEDDPVAEALADGACIWRLMDIGGPLPRNGGLLLVECRRTLAAATAAADRSAPVGASLVDPALPAAAAAVVGAAPAAVTSVPVPLLVLPERHAAAAAELERVRVYMARMLLGSENVLRAASSTQHAGDASAAAAAAAARAEAAAQVEMACQQFLMDIGVLLDAAASAATPTAAAPVAMAPYTRTTAPTLGSAPGPSSCPHPGVSSTSGGAGAGGGGIVPGGGGGADASSGTGSGLRPPPHSFDEPRSACHVKRQQLVDLQISPVCTTDVFSSTPSCSSPLTLLGGCGAGPGSERLVGWTSEPVGGGGGGGAAADAAADAAAVDDIWSFSKDMKALMRAHRVDPGVGSNVTIGPVSSGGGGGGGSAAGAASAVIVGGGYGFTEFGEHLMDVACTALAGCCAAGMHATAVMVLHAACWELSLAAPEVLLAEAGADPRVRLQLLSSYTARCQKSPPRDGVGRNAPATAAATATTGPAVTLPALGTCLAMDGPVGLGAAAAAAVATGSTSKDPDESITLDTAGIGAAVAAATGGAEAASESCVFARTPVRLSRSEPEWGLTADEHAAAAPVAAANSTLSRSHSHSLAMMLVGGPTSPLAMQVRMGDEAISGSSAEFMGWHQVPAGNSTATEPGGGSLREDGNPDSRQYEQQQQQPPSLPPPPLQQQLYAMTGRSIQTDAAAADVAAWQAAAAAAEAVRTLSPNATATGGGRQQHDEEYDDARQQALLLLPPSPSSPSSSSTPRHQQLRSRAITVSEMIAQQGATYSAASNMSACSTWGSAAAAAATADASVGAGVGSEQSRPGSNVSTSTNLTAGGAPAGAATTSDAGEASSLTQSVSASVSASPADVANGFPELTLPRLLGRPSGAAASAAPPPSMPPAAAAARIEETASARQVAEVVEEKVDMDVCGGKQGRGAAPAPAPAPGPPASTLPALTPPRPPRRNGRGRWGAAAGILCFLDPAVEAEYMQFVALRTCSIMWSYFAWNMVTSAVSCTRAWMEDGMAGCLSLVIFSGMQAAVVGWYCIAHGARDAHAMVACAIGCKAVRMLADALMGAGVLKVPSLMEPMIMRGVEMWTEVLMRPTTERVPFAIYCLMALLEIPCVWLIYCRFRALFPRYWLRNYPLIRALVHLVLTGLVNALTELYWRRAFRQWSRSVASLGGGAGGAPWRAAAGALASGGHGTAGAAIEHGAAVGGKMHRKEE
ncbi:hypothetical protein VOLCADRAFT_90650 [Volvox carteri f. nagariensis]|uniref:Uncharacterized protein n=1 Tax=Volvox carteri f. nagariensis TaxID=3068 RepID=D8TUZ1_VOLCA|nr:uncharacterized protein VOLCADRAFT_90650 [Volvox carteri f. nagariensis]EFJ48797.1 hypothetical protein VOLCADRAFT_90650 [Volvox carteri f. nagariensis]|eukprot:XP_002950129.1 hypothetical protein VOLCADRAFT_90650 [Volvox carteri f. nagariensis]